MAAEGENCCASSGGEKVNDEEAEGEADEDDDESMIGGDYGEDGVEGSAAEEEAHDDGRLVETEGVVMPG